jgi:hypothetical protein
MGVSTTTEDRNRLIPAAPDRVGDPESPGHPNDTDAVDAYRRNTADNGLV